MFKFFKVPMSDDHSESSQLDASRLQKYIQSRSMDDMKQLVTQINPEVKHLIAANVQALVGYLPSSDFNTSIMCSKDNLQNLLASAMLTGYFVHAMEYRMKMDEVFEGVEPAPEQEPKSKESAQESTLRSPEDLFEKQIEKTFTEEDIENFQSKRDSFFAQIGEFISRPELIEQLKQQGEQDFNLQFEINTNFNLEDFLKEFRILRSKRKNDKPEDET